MKRLKLIMIIFSGVISVLALPGATIASWWDSCIKVDDSFYYHIIDPDTIEIGNNKEWAFVSVNCDGVPRKNAFSKCPNGCGVFPNSSVKIPLNRTKICKGEVVFVGNDQCELGKIKAEKYPER